MSKRILIIIPAYNEEMMIGEVLKAIPRRLPGIGKVSIIVVDDGSSDATGLVARKKGATVIKHKVNCGLGAAIGTGFAYAQVLDFDIVVTLDADGQHRAVDLPRIVKPLLTNDVDVVIGSRLRHKNSMPLFRKIINWLSNIMTYVFFGIWTTDSQSGFRAFSKKAINMIQIRTQRMEVSSEIFKEIKRNNLFFVEVPIPAIYTAYSLFKGQRLSNASNVFIKLFMRSMR